MKPTRGNNFESRTVVTICATSPRLVYHEQNIKWGHSVIRLLEITTHFPKSRRLLLNCVGSVVIPGGWTQTSASFVWRNWAQVIGYQKTKGCAWGKFLSIDKMLCTREFALRIPEGIAKTFIRLLEFASPHNLATLFHLLGKTWVLSVRARLL